MLLELLVRLLVGLLCDAPCFAAKGKIVHATLVLIKFEVDGIVLCLCFAICHGQVARCDCLHPFISVDIPWCYGLGCRKEGNEKVKREFRKRARIGRCALPRSKYRRHF